LKQILDKSAPIIDHLRNWLGIGAVICAGVITPWEYIDVKQEKRVERTLSYVERYGDSGYVDSAILLDEAVNNQHAELSRLLQNSDLSTAELESGYAMIILDLFKDPKLSLSMNSVLRFHQELVQCVLNELCYRDVSMSFFANSTGDMLRTYYPYICDKRSKWNDPTAFEAIEHFYLGQSETDICKGSS
jgi:hypothetical protein